MLSLRIASVVCRIWSKQAQQEGVQILSGGSLLSRHRQVWTEEGKPLRLKNCTQIKTVPSATRTALKRSWRCKNQRQG